MPIKYLVAVVVRLVLVVVTLQSLFSFLELLAAEGQLAFDFLIKPALFFCLWLVFVIALWFRYDIFLPKIDEKIDGEINVNMVALLKVAIIGISFYCFIISFPALIYSAGLYYASNDVSYNNSVGIYSIIYNVTSIVLAIFCIAKVNWLTYLLLGKSKH